MAEAPSEADLTRATRRPSPPPTTRSAKARTQAAGRQTELTAAERSRDALAAAEQRAWAQLSSTRDTLVAARRAGHRDRRRP